MSSGFVSGGTVDNPTERDDEWRQAQAELEAARKAKADLAAQHDGKSLFEILQANKDKKQTEFEERARYKLHVSLNDEEADYLDSLEEKRRKEEASVKKDTQERLEAFRRQQEEEAAKALEGDRTDAPTEEQVQWAAGRKRKKGPETSLLKGVKLKKTISEPEKSRIMDEQVEKDKQIAGRVSAAPSENKSMGAKVSGPATTAPGEAMNPLSLGLGYASSDDDE
ncbi:N-terminal domain of NEFA-interacting nuclear protein NIP30-domain-containing protein [Ampelomyces quisqualis]|uniref:N-terminal domain of NEFA-interacting nuclear protein NIP30-domain-containing protein n=1 Tax=Ampelomyces quisqualis TaxID=50730 RepID=A0A6A5QA83_AMPQU|nr:N-terminal domain of NEFA-interacting nuclear protein NIP30-domain-containing protein [Ampelomyces quisqualis]